MTGLNRDAAFGTGEDGDFDAHNDNPQELVMDEPEARPDGDPSTELDPAPLPPENPDGDTDDTDDATDDTTTDTDDDAGHRRLP